MFHAPYDDDAEANDGALRAVKSLAIGAVITVVLILAIVAGLMISQAQAQEPPRFQCRDGLCVVPIEVVERAQFAEHVGKLCGWSGFTGE